MKVFILFLTITYSFAQDPVILQKGQMAPYTGFLITKEKAQKCLEYKLNATDCEKINKDLVYNNEAVNKMLQQKEEERLEEKRKKEWYKAFLSVLMGFLVGETIFLVSK